MRDDLRGEGLSIINLLINLDNDLPFFVGMLCAHLFQQPFNGLRLETSHIKAKFPCVMWCEKVGMVTPL